MWPFIEYCIVDLINIILFPTMKKVYIGLLSFLLISCSASQRLSKYTQQPLELSYKLNNGMSKDEVVSILGQPIKSDFSKNIEEWFYCKTAIGGDQHLALFFYEGKLMAKKNYVVTLADVYGQTGDCEWSVKKGNYREPDEVREIRIRY